MGRVFGLQLLPGRWLKDDRHGVVSSTKHSDLVDEFVGDFHEDILR